ncbi:MAG: MBL fold metallo-hydrolase [Gammaproteobacteria bacterium]|nr:MBL fold metallo-hydrolase [Gammaproteobacteria bacterium]
MNNRRQILRIAVASATASFLPFSVRAVAPRSALKVTPLRNNLSLVEGAGGNVVVRIGPGQVSLVDTGSAEAVAELLAQIDAMSGGLPVGTVFNTHWHADHTGGNDTLHQRGAEILAHENTRLWLGADFYVEWREQAHKPRPAAALPDKTFYTGGSIVVDGETIEFGHTYQAHTDGDLFIRFPASNVIAAGGLVSGSGYPIADIATGGWIGGLVDANAALLELADDNTIIVPDSGPARDKAYLQAHHDMLADIYERMKNMARDGLTGLEMLEHNVTDGYDAVWGDPHEFVLETYRGMWAHTYDMGGFI